MTLLLLLALAASAPEPAAAPRQLLGSQSAVVTVAFSPDGKQLASSGFDRVVRIWDLATGKQVLGLTGPKENVAAVAFSADGKLVAAGDGAFAVNLWSLPDGKPVRVLHNAEPIAAIAFSPDGKQLAAGGLSGTSEVFAVADGKELFEVRVHTPVFSQDSKRVLGTTKAGALVSYDTATGKVLKELKGTAPVSCVLAPDGKRLYAWSGKSKEVQILDAASGAAVGALTEAGKGISSVAISVDGAILAAASEDSRVRIYDLAKKTVIAEFPLERIGFVAISPDKSQLAVGDGAAVKVFKLP